MAQNKIIRFKRGLEANRLSITPLEAEPIYCTDSKLVYIGDGVTPGGILLNQPVKEMRNVELIGTKDSNNRIFFLPERPTYIDNIGIYRNGVRQRPIAITETFSHPDQYKYNIDENSIELSDQVEAPDDNDWIMADYTVRI